MTTTHTTPTTTPTTKPTPPRKKPPITRKPTTPPNRPTKPTPEKKGQTTTMPVLTPPVEAVETPETTTTPAEATAPESTTQAAAPATSEGVYRAAKRQQRGAEEALAAVRARLENYARQLEQLDREGRNAVDDASAEQAAVERVRRDLEQARVNATFRRDTVAEAIYRQRIEELSGMLAGAEQRLERARAAASARVQSRAAERDQLIAEQAKDTEAEQVLESEVTAMAAAAAEAMAAIGDERYNALRSDLDAAAEALQRAQEAVRTAERALDALPARARRELAAWPDHLRDAEAELSDWIAPRERSPLEKAFDTFEQWLKLLSVPRGATAWWTTQPAAVFRVENTPAHASLPRLLSITAAEMHMILADPQGRGRDVLRQKAAELILYKQAHLPAPDTAADDDDDVAWW